MKFTSVFVSAILAACVQAKATFSNSAYNVQAGKPFTLTWLEQEATSVTILLKNGDKDALNTVLTIVSGTPGPSFTWTPPAGLASDSYAFEIQDNGKQNFSPRFDFVGVPASSSSTSSSRPTSSPTSAPTTSPSSSSTPPNSSAPTSSSPSSPAPTTNRPTATGTNTNLNSGVKFQSSSLAFVLVVAATLFFMH